MTKIDDAIFGLLNEKVIRAPVPRRVVSEKPDALVLCLIEAVCNTCGSIYDYPSALVLGRFGEHRKRIPKWSVAFAALPRETMVITQETVCCKRCFTGAHLTITNMEKPRD